ncbi:unnamed protein product [Trichogramma brassicae]|uniref:Uncharacterized protein n=1 Tax=Trichogramma brassicae TaxID=86971 RepID=A0A6H5HW44_9HYME|nr:unnamed protein product [Trichogramma brassicae]
MPLHQGFQNCLTISKNRYTLGHSHPDRRHVCTNRSQSVFSTDGFHFLAQQRRSRSRLIRAHVRREAPRSAMQARRCKARPHQPVPSSGK